MAHRSITIDQLPLFDLPPAEPEEDAEARMIAAGILRHRQVDLADHQRGWVVLDWDTAGGDKKGDLIPAWICCVCGEPEPNEYWLTMNHSCYLIPGCAIHPPEERSDRPWQFRLADPDLIRQAGLTSDKRRDNA